MTQPGALVVARDAGAASALAPVVAALVEEGDLPPQIVAWGNARAIFDAEELPVLAFPEDPAPDEIADLLVSIKGAVMLTGTSLRADLDSRFWTAAAAAAIPSVALLDHWKNYTERFTISASFDALPTVIAVMDDVAERELVARGCPAGRVRVTGQPRFDSLSVAVVPELRAGARAQLGIELDRRVVVFASEPRGVPYDDGSGFTQAEALQALLNGVEAVAPDALVVVKLHPVEQDQIALPERGPEVRVLRDWAMTELASAADVFCGMTSIVLLDAALLGVPTVSIRPGGGPSHFIEAHAELISTAATPADTRAALEEGLARGHRPPASPLPSGAATRVCRLLAELTAAHGIMRT